MSLEGKKIAVFLGKGFEDRELIEPVEALREAGAEVVIIGLWEDDRQQGAAGKHGTIVRADVLIDEVDQRDFDLLVIPGGKGPATLRLDQRILDFVRAFDAEAKPIAAICHGPQVLVSAGVLQERTATSFFTVARELKRAGAHFRNQPVVIDGNLITSRQPGDIPKFIDAIVTRLQTGEPVARKSA